ncbi:MAG: hypothetical protein JSS29_07555 [Proteobacteria bacterium]|nr:hypothetical protein [Pseudomonadota bacterium]
MRALLGWLLGAAALTWSATAAPATQTSEDTGYANYAFASELGSGVYEINGSVIQVYQLHPKYTLRDAARPGGRPGIRLVFPVTVGFFNFQLQDLAHLELPTHIGAVSLEPGIEFDYWLHEDWHVYPYLKGGATWASSSEVNAYIWDLGVRSDYRFSLLDTADLWRADLVHARVHYHSVPNGETPLPDDSFTRLRNGVELRRSMGDPWRERRFELGLYGISDIYLDAPHGPESGISARTLQFEFGLMFGMNPMYQVWGIPVPRIGIGYRDAGVLSGWRLVLGEPF